VYLVVFVVFFLFCSISFSTDTVSTDTVGWVLWLVKTVSHITYTVLVGT